MTSHIDASTKLNEFYFGICQKNVSVLTHGISEILRHFQLIRYFLRDQRLRLDFEGKLLTEDVLKWQRNKILLAPLAVRNKNYPFREDLIPDASGNTDPQLVLLAKVSSLVDLLQLNGSYKLVERLRERLILTASRVDVTVAWSSNEVFVSCGFPPEHLGSLFVTILSIHLFRLFILNGMFPRILARFTEWVKALK